MPEKITVRFVPKSRSSLSFEDFSSAPTTEIMKTMEPKPADMRRGQAQLMQKGGIETKGSEKNRLVADLEESNFRELFGDVRLDTHTTSERGNSVTENETFQTPKALEIPDSLKSTIAFAYVPRPVEYFAPLATPPKEHIYHMRLSDVTMSLNAPRCHRRGWTGSNIRVAMADSGFWLHPHFIRGGYALLPTESPGSGPADIDASGHGTGEAANIFAIAPNATVYGVKTGSSTAGTLETCIAQNPHVMTNSWGWDIDHQDRETLRINNPNMFNELLDVEQIIADATANKIVVCFSAGNGHFAFPACFPDVLAVGGVTVNEDGSLEASSYASAFTSQIYPDRNVPDVCGIVGRSEGPPMTGHIMLPVPPKSRLDGSNFPSGAQETGWGIFSGTSASCPQVAGLVALLKQINSSLTTSQVKHVLEVRSIDVSTGTTATGETASQGPDLATGSGLVDALRACGYYGGMA